ncbi:hypothetical protein Dform_01345 [Dehalogenimonas formicexedens]|uniref:Uncharacterized protein n=1 Tax=Dehalogenimonas formicexedens TaxID=1839801 RepID=A0A1P8F868_9CHLR|nr:hypothetical protein [Dehalogenimonas formicexedens]APV44669.1 hypothetical protein Dform_01345 [Dehalogenimonas formicexedens]
MTVSYKGGVAKLFAKDIDKPVADARYQMMLTRGTRFTPGKWWGDFSTNKELKTLGELIMEFEDGSRGEIFVYASGMSSAKNSRFQYTFNGRGKLGGFRGRGMAPER